MAAVERVISSLDTDRERGVRHVAGVLRDVVKTANKRAGAVGDIALMLVAAQRAAGPIE